MRAVAHAFAYVLIAILGWFGGSLYPAPPALIGHLSPQALLAHARGDLAGIQRTQGLNWTSIRSVLGPDEAKRLADDAIRVAQQAGSAIKVEHVVDEATKEAEQQVPIPLISLPPPPPPAVPVVPTTTAQSQPSSTAKPTPAVVVPPASSTVQSQPSSTAKPAPPSAAAAPASPTSQSHPVTTVPTTSVVTASQAPVRHGAFEPAVSLCPGMTISDAPPSDTERHIANFSPLVTVNSVVLAVDPVRDACFSSGFGSRNGRLHKGVDFYNPGGGPILAAGDGTVLEMKYRDDYGNMLLIDHGHGVYTRYAHLSSFHNGLAVGAHVHAGDEIGLMGNTAGYPVPLHLHYEILLGDYTNPKGSFGLTPHSPFEYRAAM